MSSYFRHKSLLFSLFTAVSVRVYESYLLTLLLALNKKLVGLLFLSKALPFKNYPLKSIIIFVFIVSLGIVPGYDIWANQFQQSSFSGSGENRNAVIFGIVLFLSLILPLFMMLLRQQKERVVRVKFYSIEILLIGFFFIAFLSTIFSIQHSFSFNWLLKLSRGLSVYFIFAFLKIDQKDIKYLISAYIVVILFEGVISFLQFINGGLVGLPVESLSKIVDTRKVILSIENIAYFRVVGTFAHPNVLSSYMILLLPLVIVSSFSFSTIFKRLSHLAAIISFATIILALSRWALVTSILTLFLSLGLLWRYAYQVVRENIFSIKLYFFIFLLVSFTILTNSVFSSRFLDFSSDERSFTARLELISQAKYILQQYPVLGLGGSTFPFYLINYDYTATSVSERYIAPVHNFYLLLATEIGLIGLAIWLGVIIGVIKIFLLNIKTLPEYKKLITIGLFSSIIIFCFHGLWELRSVTDHVTILFWLELGLLMNFFRSGQKLNLR